MKNSNVVRALRDLSFALSLLLVVGTTSAAPYQVHLDTNTLAGFGWLDLQFNPGQATAPAATATVSTFSGAVGNEAPQVFGDVRGTLPGVVTFGNTTAFNNLFQKVNLGGLIDFSVDFSGAFLRTIDNIGTSFAVALYADDMMTPLGNADAAGSLANFALFPASADGAGQVTFTIADASIVSVVPGIGKEVPEPGQVPLFILGLIALGMGSLPRRSK
ncbi:MAG: NF038129 family PEP-CTERM protein [Herminiimonas sp.]|nr:NF038129 family PEP-CTERM protein [Herminiimonas sp.]